VFRHLPWYKGDWREQVRELLDAFDKLPARPTDPSDLRLGVIGRLVLDRLGGDPRKPAGEGESPKAFGPNAWQGIHSPLMEYREVRHGTAGAVRPHGFLRLAWRDEVDDSPQYARAYLPPDYDPQAAERTWPMIVVLHGYNPPNPEYIHWWGVTNRHNSIAERHNVIVLEPHGRGNTSYNGIGDADVLRAIRLAKETFRVDEDRVYLTGYSMGGGGTWHIGTRHPELFAAIAPIYGGWDYHQRMEEDELAKLTPRQKYEMESWSSFAQAESLLTTPVFVNHGDADSLVDVKFSRYAARMLQRWGYNLRYWEHPGGGHGRLGCEDELVRWLLTHKLDRDPRRVRVRSARLKSASAHWVSVRQREDPYAFIQADARVVDSGTIRLDTANALEVRLSPGPKLVDRDRPVRVIWNGRDVGSYAFFPGGAVTVRAAGYDPAPGMFHKTPQIAGPIDDATTTPFAIVEGTASEDPAMRRFCRFRAEAARDEWRRWQKVTPRYFLDTEITDEQVRTYSL
ncbi:MAG: prolyl oligopeptidase family serine peptidase, partial [Phycisphaerae bacterium]